MSSWANRYYNGAALQGGFKFPGGFMDENPATSDPQKVGASVWATINPQLTPSQLASAGMTYERYGAPVFFDLLGRVAIQDSLALSILRDKEALKKATTADQARQAQHDLAVDRAAVDVYKVEDKRLKPIMTKFRRWLHGSRPRMPKTARAYIMDLNAPYGINPALRYLGRPAGAEAIKRMADWRRDHPNATKASNARMADYKYLRSAIKQQLAKGKLDRAAPWTEVMSYLAQKNAISSASPPSIPSTPMIGTPAYTYVPPVEASSAAATEAMS